jgi:hypothetical protein
MGNPPVDVLAAARSRWLSRFGKRGLVLEVGVGVVVAVVYLLTLSGNHSETEDSINFARRIRDDPHSQFFEGTHVIFDWVAWAIYHLVRLTGITQDPLRSTQVFDALLGALTIAFLVRILIRGGVSHAAALVASGVLAFSYGFWRNSVEVEVYTLSAFTLVLCLAAALHAKERPSGRAFAGLGAANGLAILAETTNVLFAAVAIAAMLLARRKRSLGSVRRWFGVYAGAGCAVVLPVYAAAAGVLGLDSPKKFWDWFTAETSGQSYGHVSVGAVTYAVVGCARALVGAHSALVVPTIRAFVHHHLRSKPLREEYFFLGGFSTALAEALLVGSAVLGLLIVALAAQWLSRRVRLGLDEGARTLTVLCTVWLVAYIPLFTFWDPLNIELWYVVWLPAALLLALPLTAGRTPTVRLGLGTLVVVGLLVVNLLGSQVPERENGKDYWRVRAAWYHTHLRSDDLLIAYDYVWSTYLGYLTRAHVVDAQAVFKKEPPAAAAEEVRHIADSSHARRVFLSDYDFDPYPGDPAACNDGMHTCRNTALLREMLRSRSRVVARTRLERVWEYERPRTAAAVGQ